MTTEAGRLDTTSAAPARAKPRWTRRILMLVVPVLLAAVGTYVWLGGGRAAKTDNAYVQQNLVAVSADIAGRIVEVAVHENDHVDKGQLLFRLDPEPFRLAVAQADAAIASARIGVEQMRAAYQANLTLKRSADQNLVYYQAEFDRTQKLTAGGNATDVKLSEARHAVDVANQAVATATSAVAASLAALGGKPDIATDAHPLVQEAFARRDLAARQLDLATIAAPTAGIVSQTARLQVGQYVAPGTAVLGLVATTDTWIEANFKETDLTNMQIGQAATVSFDTFPGKEFPGVVEGIGAATGAEFSVLPAQNATGNWVKVVQRVPVRVRLTDAPVEALRAGMSASVAVQTGFRRKLPDVLGKAEALVQDMVGASDGATATP